MQKSLAQSKVKPDDGSRELANAHKEAQIIVEDAKLKAEKLLFESQKRADDMLERKNQIERRLKEFIAAERELIKNYESEED